MGQKQRSSKEDYRIMPYVVVPRNSKKRNIIYLNIKFISLKLRQKAESVDVLDKC